MSEIKEGDMVQVHYTGRLEDGSVFDSSEGREPLEFKAGGDEVIPGFSRAVIGMQPGDSRTVTICPEDGYGPHYPDRTQRVPLGILPEGVEVGSALQAQTEDGLEGVMVWVTEMTGEDALLDANHPLAGQTLIFDILIVGEAA
jgi:peptidylprolyl isomerase